MSPSYAIKIGKTKWLTGLAWRSFEDAPKKIDIKSDAEQLNATWYATRIGESSIQCGFGNPPTGHKGGPNGLYSLAAMLADSEQQPWLGIFKLEEGLWWYIAVRDGHAILPDGDLVGNEEFILAARERHAGYADWNYIEGGIQDLANRINSIKAKKTPVRSLTGGNYSPATIGLSAAIIVGTIAGYLWWQHQGQLAIQARQAAMAKMRLAMANQQPAPLPSPLLSTPNASAWLSACRNVIDKTPLSVNGWLLSNSTCETKAVTLLWKRGGGATVATKPDGEPTDNNTVVTTIPLSVENGINDAIDLAQAKTLLVASLQKSGIDLQINQMPVAPVLPGQTSAPVAVAQAQLPFSFDTSISIFALNMQIPGLRLNKITTTATGWHAEGVLYGK